VPAKPSDSEHNGYREDKKLIMRTLESHGDDIKELRTGVQQLQVRVAPIPDIKTDVGEIRSAVFRIEGQMGVARPQKEVTGVHSIAVIQPETKKDNWMDKASRPMKFLLLIAAVLGFLGLQITVNWVVNGAKAQSSPAPVVSIEPSTGGTSP